MDNPADPKAVSEELRRRVEERRRAQEFPEHLREDLDRHYRRIVEHRTKLGVFPLPDLRSHIEIMRREMAELERSLQFDVKKINTSSEIVGGRAFHSAVNRIVSRQLGGVFDQVAEFAHRASDMLRTLQDAVSILEEHIRSSTDVKLDVIWEWFAELEQPPSADLETRHLAARLARIERKVGPLGQLEGVQDLPRLRGYPSQSQVSKISAHLSGSAPIADLAAGVSDVMASLVGAGVEVTAADASFAAAELSSSKGLEVKLSDPLDFLEAIVDGSLGAVVAIGVAERLSPSELQEFGRLLSTKIRPGGTAVIGAIRPESPAEWGFAMANDPTYVRPVAPALLKALLSAVGFRSFEEWNEKDTYQIIAGR